MRRLTVSVPVLAPSGFTLAYLRSYFQERAQGEAAADLRLRLPLDSLAAGLSLERPVAVEVRYVTHPGACDEVGISWSARGTGAFPHFAGTFEAGADHDERCRLTLTGTYAPPGGIAGAAFDAVLGNRIARATIEGLLQRVAAAAADDYRLRVAL